MARPNQGWFCRPISAGSGTVGRLAGDPSCAGGIVLFSVAMHRVLIIFSLLLMLIFFGGFWLSGGNAARPRAIIFCQAGQIHTLDPAGMTWIQDIRAGLALWEGLAQYNPKTLNPMPGVARTWTVSPDGLTYTFHLRRNARWSNGDPVTTADFIFAWKRMLHPATGAGYVEMLFHIAGARAYFNALAQPHAKPRPFSSVGVKALNLHTLVVHLGAPCPYFLDLLAFPPFFPLNQHSMARFAPPTGDPMAGYNPRFTRPPHLVTDGAYRLAAWKFHQYLELKPNIYYWDRKAVHCRELRIVSFSDSLSAFRAYQSGAVDVLSFVPPQFTAALLRQQKAGLRHDVHYRSVFGTYYYIINCTRAPLTNPLIRRALDLAIDKSQIVNDVTRLHERPLRVLVPPGAIPGYQSPRGLAMNVPEARRLMRQAGYPDGRGMRALKFLTNDTDSLNLLIAQAIAQMWQRNLGVRIRIETEESKAFNQDCVQGNFDIARAGWYGDYMDPTTWLDLFRTGNPNNHSRFSNQAFDQLMHQSDIQPNPARRFALLTAAERLLVDRFMPAIPLFQYTDGLMYHSREIGGIRPNVRMITLLKYIHWKRRPHGDAHP